MKTKVVCKVNVVDNAGPGDFPASGNMAENFVATLLDGVGANKAQVVFADTRIIAGGANEDLGLSGVLENSTGEILSMTQVKTICITADSANADDVKFGPAAANGFIGPFADASDRLNVAPGGCAFLVAPGTGWPVTNGSADLINVDGGAGGVKYTIVIIAEGTKA